MPEKIIVYFHDHETVSWGKCASGGQWTFGLQQPLKEISQLTHASNVMVIIPAYDASVLTVQLPKMSKSKLIKAIPYAIEDQLVDDIDALHFAILKIATHDMTVGVINKTKMQYWLDVLRESNIHPAVIVPASLAIDAEAQTINIHLIDRVALIAANGRYVSCDTDYLQSLMHSICQAEEQLETVKLRNYSGTQHSFEFNALPIVEESRALTDFLTDAEQTLSSSQMNFLQNEFVKKTNHSKKSIDAVRISTIAIGLSALLFGLFPFISYAFLNSRAAQLNQEITVIYKKQFPNATAVIAPKQRIAAKLNNEQVGEVHARLLILLINIGEALANSEHIKLQQLDYQNNRVIINVIANSSAEFTAFTKDLAKNNLQVHQQNASLDGTLVQATLEIE